MFAGKKSAQIREILISESAWEEMTCLFAPSLNTASKAHLKKPAISNPAMRLLMTTTALGADQIGQTFFQAKEQR